MHARDAPRVRAGRPPALHLLRPGEDAGGHRHLRRAVPRPQRRDPRNRDGTDPSLRRAADLRLSQRLPGFYPALRTRRARSHARPRQHHRRGRRHDPRHLPRQPGSERDRRLSGADEHQRPLRDRRRWQHSRRDADRGGDRRAGAEDCRGRYSQDDRQRHPLHRPEFRIPDGVRRGHALDQGGACRGEGLAQRGRPRETDGPPLRLHRLLCVAGGA